VYGSGASASPPAPASDASSAPGQRYNYLVGRLRNRQITMEEATELFSLMQAMLARANETARLMATRSAAAAGVPSPPIPTGAAPRLVAAGSSSDDFLLMGLLAMGAGAGLLAALSKRIGDSSSSTPPASARSKSSPAPR